MDLRERFGYVHMLAQRIEEENQAYEALNRQLAAN